MPDETDSDNFFKQQRDKLGLSPTEMGARVGMSANTVRLWERDILEPRAPIASLAAAYEVTEARMEREVMALRRRIEAKRSPVGAGK